MKYDDVLDGKVYRSYFDKTMGASEVLNIQFTTPPNKTVVFESLLVASISNNLRVKSYEGVDLTDGTTEIHTINSNFQSDKTPQTKLFSDPTNISGGELKSSIFVPAITSGPSLKILSPFTITDTNVSILKPGTDYIIEITNQDASETIIDLQILFKEL